MKSIVLDSSFVYLLSICLLLIIVFLMLFRLKHGDRKAGRFLLGYFVSYLYLIGITYLFVYGDAILFIHSLRTGHATSLLMPVFAFFYIRQCLYPRGLKWNDLWHLLPIVFFVVDFAPFFMSSTSEKISIFQAMDAVEYRIGFSQGWFVPKYGHIAIRTALLLGYWIAQFRLVRKAQKENYHPLRLQYPFTWRWLHIFIATQAFIFILPLAGIIFNNSQVLTVIYSMAAAGTMAIQCFYLLIHPEILYTQTFGSEVIGDSSVFNNEAQPENSLEAKKQTSTITTSTKPVENKFTDYELNRIEASIQHLMDTQRPFEKQRYTLHEFAVDTKMTPHKLSAFINTRYGKNFNDYLNKFRITLVIEKLQAGENELKTLEAIAFESGFQSRITFIRAFKKEHGITPSEYLIKMNS